MNIKFLKGINRPLLNKAGKYLCAVVLASSPLFMTSSADGLEMPEISKPKNITGESNINVNDFREIIDLKFARAITMDELKSLLNTTNDTVSIEIDGTVITIPKEKLEEAVDKASIGHTSGLSDIEEVTIILTMLGCTLLLSAAVVVDEVKRDKNKQKTKGRKK